MGNGIAHVFALHNFEVNLIDLHEEQLASALATVSRNLDRMVKKDKITSEQKVAALVHIHGQTDLVAGVADAELVIEAVSENASLKKEIFGDLNEYTQPHCILASNTSSISITSLAAMVDEPERVIGMHFMNPVPVMKLVEVIRAYQTSDETTRAVLAVCDALNKTAVEVNDYPGFVSNRILMPLINEAIYARFEGVADVDAIDAVMRLGMAHPMGPLQLADFIGLDVCLDIMKVLHQGLGHPKYAPCPLLINMVNAGHLGKKSGIGFYDYHSSPPQVAEMFR